MDEVYTDYAESLLEVQSLLKKQYDLLLNNRANEAASLIPNVLAEVKMLQNAIQLEKERQR